MIFYSLPICEAGCTDNSDCFSDSSRPHCNLQTCSCESMPCPKSPNDVVISIEKSKVTRATKEIEIRRSILFDRLNLNKNHNIPCQTFYITVC